MTDSGSDVEKLSGCFARLSQQLSCITQKKKKKLLMPSVRPCKTNPTWTKPSAQMEQESEVEGWKFGTAE